MACQMPDNSTGCTPQARSRQVVPILLRRNARRHSRQNYQLCHDHRTHLRPSQAPCTPSAAPLIQAVLQASAHFPHRIIQDPRGFLLPRFVNVGRHLMVANVVPRPTSKNLQESGPSLQV
jgi:hypothetical protein